MSSSDEAAAQRLADTMFEDDEPGWTTKKLSVEEQEVLAAAAAALAAGPEFRTVSYHFDGCTVPLTYPLRGPAASDSTALSTRVWRAALVLSRAMVKEAASISLKGATVLELGAGMGLCGLLAAQLGAREVVITDCSYVGLKVLLRNCNDARGVVQLARLVAAVAGGALDPRTVEAAGEGVLDAGSAARIAAAIADVYGDRLTPGWGVVGDVMSIRRHLWEEDVPHLGEVRHWSNDVLGGAVGAEGLPPPLEVGARFDIVIAADVLYFFEQVEPLLHTIAARLTPGGVAMMTVTLRRPAVYERFLDGLPSVGLELVKGRGVGAAAEMEVDPVDLHHLEAGGDVHTTANEMGPIMLVYLSLAEPL